MAELGFMLLPLRDPACTTILSAARLARGRSSLRAHQAELVSGFLASYRRKGPGKWVSAPSRFTRSTSGAGPGSMEASLILLPQLLTQPSAGASQVLPGLELV